MEDFGILPVEAMASGAPVIAYGNGGILDSTVPDKTAIYFAEQTSQSLEEAIRLFEAKGVHWSAQEIAAHTQRFSRQRFITEMDAHIRSVL